MIDKNKTVFCFALKEEAGKIFSEFNCLFTGMGKINAAHSLTKYCMENKQIELVVNLGTCGAKKLKPNTLVCSTVFYQRDWHVPPVAFVNESFEKLEYGEPVKNLVHAACGTGDSFVGQWNDHFAFEIVDMEAYALAKVCAHLNKRFICIKSVSDDADEESDLPAIEQWNRYLAQAAVNLKNALNLI